ncbi:MAG TPA: hypothetical protein VF591_00050 [Pyrinomonadaceae bacterium]|jgi:hypothetical protein
MQEIKRENYFLFTTIRFGDSVVERVPCKVYLPRKVADLVALHVLPNPEQERLLDSMFEFSIFGEIEHPNGAVTTIRADKAYSLSGEGRRWGPELSEYVMFCEPTDLKVIHTRAKTTSPVSEKIYGVFWLTPSKVLTPGQIIGRHPSGRVSVKTGRWKHTFTLKNVLRLDFKKRYIHWENEDGDDVTSSELVAEYRQERGHDITVMDRATLDCLDDLLLLVSFASRRPCVCARWDVSNAEGYRIEYYRRDIGIPAGGPEDRDDWLIDYSNFKQFVRSAYRNFYKVEPRDYLRQAIVYTIPDERRSPEGSFVTLYEALESLVLYFRRRPEHRLEFVFPSDESGKGGKWKARNQIIEDTKKFLSEHPLLKNDPVKRGLLFDNLLGLNRVSFRTALERMCEAYSVDLDEFWPITKSGKGWSLSTIRNKLVHGEHLTHQHRHALVAAGEHLRWIVERLILAVLGWDIEKSNVSTSYLAERTYIYQDWEADLKILSDPK